MGQAKTNPFSGKYYISLGDSYSVGYQPGIGATTGYTGYVASKLKMTLENFGCGGATTTSLNSYTGVCGTGGSFAPPAIAGTVGPVIPGNTQVQNAEAFIADVANQGKVGLVTISIGGNDVTSCASAANPITCVSAVKGSIQTNVTAVVSSIEAALVANGDASAPVVGLTYPDVILGDWVHPTYSPGNSLVTDSVLAFKLLINPALNTAYTSVSTGKFVDVTTATGAYTPLTTVGKMPKSTGVTDVPKGTTVPVAVIDVCKLTYFCTLGDIHSNNKGYLTIGKLIKKAL